MAVGLRHVVTLTFRDETTDATVEEILAALRALPDRIAEIQGYVVGADVGVARGVAEGNASLAIVGDFASTEDYVAYRDHPAHGEVIQMILPHLAARSAVQHET